MMFQIMPLIYNAEQQKAQAEANLLQIEYQNTKQLADSNVVSPNELAMAKSQRYDKTKQSFRLNTCSSPRRSRPLRQHHGSFPGKGWEAL